MAATDFKPSRKPFVYDLMGRFNAASARVTRSMNALEQVGIFDQRTACAWQRSSNWEKTV